MYTHNTEARSRNNCCRGKDMRFTYSERVFAALVILHAKRMAPYYTVLSVALLALPYFSVYLIIHGANFWGEKLLNITCVF